MADWCVHKKIMEMITEVCDMIKSTKHGDVFRGCDLLRAIIAEIQVSKIGEIVDTDLLMIGHAVLTRYEVPAEFAKPLFFRKHRALTILSDLGKLLTFFNAYNTTLKNGQCELMPGNGKFKYEGGGQYILTTDIGVFLLDKGMETNCLYYDKLFIHSGVLKIQSTPLETLFFKQFNGIIYWLN